MTDARPVQPILPTSNLTTAYLILGTDWLVDFLRVRPDGTIEQRPVGGWPLDV